MDCIQKNTIFLKKVLQKRNLSCILILAVTYYRAIAELAGGDIFIYNENVSGPVSARYGNDNYFRPIFLDKCGRPIVPFWI